MITLELKSTSCDDKPLIQVSPEVTEGIFGEESPENLPRFDKSYHSTLKTPLVLIIQINDHQFD